MKRLPSTRLLTLAIALGAIGAAAVLVATARPSTSSRSRVRAASGALVTLRKTSLGAVLVDARGRTLYLFEKDRKGVSACNTACIKFWPALTSQGTPRAGKGVRPSLLQLSRPHNGRRQVIYAGHPLYTFVGDTRPGQTTGEGLTNFGAGRYAVAASGRKVEESQSTGGGYGSSGGW